VHRNLPARHGVLLAGPHGSGKELLVHMACNELGGLLLDLSPTNLIKSYNSSKKYRRILLSPAPSPPIKQNASDSNLFTYLLPYFMMNSLPSLPPPLSLSLSHYRSVCSHFQWLIGCLSCIVRLCKRREIYLFGSAVQQTYDTSMTYFINTNR
jgi:hypothetical protein